MRYYMLNKPKDTLTACRDERGAVVMDCFPEGERAGLFPVGRLDRDTEGFLLVTDDGTLSFSLMQPEFHVEKTYYFYALGVLDDEKCRALEAGVPIFENGKRTAPAKIRRLGSTTLREILPYLSGKDRKVNDRRGDQPVTEATLTITEGKKHQVKRMLKAVRCRVLYLRRIAIGGVTLDPALAPGEYRPLTDGELAALFAYKRPPPPPSGQ